MTVVQGERPGQQRVTMTALRERVAELEAENQGLRAERDLVADLAIPGH
jgi:cell division protein FtsB